MKSIKNYLYIDQPLVNSIFSQYYEGLITSVSSGSTDKASLKGSFGVNLKIVKANIGAEDSGESTTSEKLELHHYMIDILLAGLSESNLIGEGKPIVKLDGDITIIDARNSAESLEGMPSLLKGMEAALKLSNQDTAQSKSSLQQMKAISAQGKDLGKLVRQFARDGVFAYINDEKISLDRECILSRSVPEFSNLGKEFKGNYVVIGIQSYSEVNTSVKSDDMLLNLSTAFSGLQDMLRISGIRPLAIYREISEDE